MSGRRAFLASGPSERLDRFLARHLSDWSRTRIQALIKDGAVRVNDRAEPSRHQLNPGDRVTIDLPAFSQLPAAAADDVPLLFEDEDLLVVDKPAGLVVHPAGPHRTDTLIQRLWPKLAPGWAQGLSSNSRPGVVHRLDRGTSGVMVIAKNRAAAEHLSRQFADRTVTKVYWAVVDGVPRGASGRIRSMVGRSRSAPQRMTTAVPGRWAETEYRVIAVRPDDGGRRRSLLEVRPKTGRTHQIRVQLAALGHPLVGDPLYGGPAGPRPLLHAHRLEFRHPRTGERLAFVSPAPPDIDPRPT